MVTVELDRPPRRPRPSGTPDCPPPRRPAGSAAPRASTTCSRCATCARPRLGRSRVRLRGAAVPAGPAARRAAGLRLHRRAARRRAVRRRPGTPLGGPRGRRPAQRGRQGGRAPGCSPASPLPSRCSCVSGRIGFEIVQKAVVADVGVLAAVGAPSSLAVHLASRAGLCTAGFVPEPAVRRLLGGRAASACEGRFCRRGRLPSSACASSTPPTGTWAGRSTVSGCSVPRRRTSTTCSRSSSPRSVDLVVVSGDVYDRALPPVDAVELADDTFARLAASRRPGRGLQRQPRLGRPARLQRPARRRRRRAPAHPLAGRRHAGAARGRARPGRRLRHPLPRARRGPRRLGARRPQPRGRADRGDGAGATPTSPPGPAPARWCWRTPSSPAARRGPPDASDSERDISVGGIQIAPTSCSPASTTPRSATCTAGRP